MSIKGIGTDIVNVQRIANVLTRNPRFARRVLTLTEYERFQRHAKPAAFLAKRWAAKEAAAKALGTGIGQVSFQHIHIGHTPAGQPTLEFTDAAQLRAAELGINEAHISLSDERDFAIAYVILSANSLTS